MAEAQFETSSALEQALNEWGLRGEFESAQHVVRAGTYQFNPYIAFTLAAGTYIAVMKNGKVALGGYAGRDRAAGTIYIGTHPQYSLTLSFLSIASLLAGSLPV